MRHPLRRAVTVAGAAAAAVAVSATAASAHSCFIPLYTLNAPASENWETINAETAAGFLMDYTVDCAAQSTAGYDALRAAGLPVAIKIFVKGHIGESSANPNRGDGKGLEDFEFGSPVPEQMVSTWVVAAQGTPCA